MSEKIKVLVSLTSLGMGGTVIFVMNFFRHLDKEKFQIDFVVYDDSRMDFYEEVKSYGGQVYVCSAKPNNRYMRLYSEMRQTRNVLREHHYDIIYCQGNSFMEFFRGMIPGKLTGNTFVITHSHNPGEPKHSIVDNVVRAITKTFVSHVVDIGCTCSDVAARGKYTDRFMNSSRYQLINNAIDTERFKFNETVRTKVRTELGIGEDVFVIGHVGRISYQKNHSFLIDIFNLLVREKPDAKLLLVGDGEQRPEIEDKVMKYQLENKVIFVGKSENPAQYYHAMDCFVLPSLYEGFPFVLVEAQVNGLRCVVSDTISRSVNISGGVDFVSLEYGVGVWSKKILSFGKQRMSEQEVQQVEEQYELSREVKKMESMFERLVRG